MEDTLDNLLEDLTLNQLKDLLLTLLPNEAAKAAYARKPDLKKVLESYPNKEKLMLAAQKIEAIATHKHVLPLTLKGAWDYKEIKSKLSSAYPAITNKLDPNFLLPLYSMAPQLFLFDDDNQRIFLKFNHQVEAVRWESISKDEKIRRRFRRRHPVVVCFRTSLRLISIEFMGFTQISIDQEPLRYSKIAREITDLLEATASIEMAPCVLRPSIQALLRDPLSEVSDCKLSLSDFEGKMSFSSENEEQNLAQFLSRYLATVGVKVSVTEAREVLGGGDTEDVALLWKRHQILTRISLSDPIPEILFVWRGVDASSVIIDDVLKKLISTPSSLDQVSIDEVRNHLFDIAARSVVRPTALAKRFLISEAEAMRLLVELKNLRVYDFCFRIKGNIEEELDNPWKSSQSDLPILTDKNGMKIDPLNLKNIEVAFQKVKSA